MYPVVTMGEGCHKGSRDKLLGLDASAAMIDAYSCERHMPADAPPTWICLAADDTTVPPIENGVAYFSALQAAPTFPPKSMSLMRAAMASASPDGRQADAAWPDLLLHWGVSHGFFKNVSAAQVLRAAQS